MLFPFDIQKQDDLLACDPQVQPRETIDAARGDKDLQEEIKILRRIKH